MSGPEFEAFCRLIKEKSGLILTPAKAYLVSSRLTPVARAEGFETVPKLLAHLQTGGSDALVERCVEAMATHESFFFRDVTPFDILSKNVLPQLAKSRANSRSLRIWCAACSSGQEPYSVAMLLEEHSALFAGWRIEIVATDMSKAILKKASTGIYSDFEVGRGLSEDRRKRWFTKEGAVWKVAPQLQRMVTFRTHNLLSGSATMGGFDVIFCRNVLIYFEVEQKRKVLEGLSRSMPEDGSLFLGSAETVLGLTDAFELTPGAAGLFRRTGSTLLKKAG